MKKKTAALLLAAVLMLGCGIGGTLAWLLDKTETVTNTFTTSDINITLTETEKGTDYNFKMIPGYTLAKDPLITVQKNSEKCYLFVKVTETDGKDGNGNALGFDKYLSYDVITETSDGDTGTTEWIVLRDKNNNPIEGVYYRVVTESIEDQTFNIIYHDVNDDNVCDSGEENKIKVLETVTKDMMEDLQEDGAVLPTLSFTAYATQYYKSEGTEFGAYDAWLAVSEQAQANSGQ